MPVRDIISASMISRNSAGALPMSNLALSYFFPGMSSVVSRSKTSERVSIAPLWVSASRDAIASENPSAQKLRQQVQVP